MVLDIVRRSGKPLHELTADLTVFPQVIVNVKVKEKRPLSEFVTITDTIRAAEAELKDNGRVVVRYSGTESLARVMIEAESQSLMEFHAERIAGAIRKELGVGIMLARDVLIVAAFRAAPPLLFAMIDDSFRRRWSYLPWCSRSPPGRCERCLQ